MIPRYIPSASALVTTHEATCQGFLDQAKVKTEKATDYVENARRFAEELKKTETAFEVLRNPRLREGLIATAGVSAKARNYLIDQDIERILSRIIEGIPGDCVNAFREELLYRYL
jgi:hypothetical protein